MIHLGYKCECGNIRFRYVFELHFDAADRDKDLQPFKDFDYECIKCGTIYSRYGEKEKE